MSVAHRPASPTAEPLPLVRPILSPAIMARASAELQSTPTVVSKQLDDVQRELDALRAELGVLRSRDETLNFYMRRLDEELRLAARLQRDFLPRTLPAVGGVRFAVLFRPAGYVSGDIYDVVRLDEHHVGIYIADAVGHGMPAALLTIFIKQALRMKEILAGGYRLLNPSEALARLNEAMIEQELSHAAFATAIYATIDSRTRQVTLARAGHPLAIVIRPDGTIHPVASEGGLLGIFPGEICPDVTVQLQSGDRFILYSDGMDVAFGNDDSPNPRWQRELLDLRHLPGEQLIAEFAARIDTARGDAEQKDDLTLLIAEVS
jgi:sigma-B regulation protein RsbU (phosphoserine phosphatase)